MRISQIIICLMLLMASAETLGQTKIVVRQQQTQMSKKFPKTNTVAKLCIMSSFHDGMAIVSAFDSDNYGLVDTLGNVVIPCKWHSCSNFIEGLAIVKDKNYNYGFIDKSGTLVIPCKWKFAFAFSEGMACVQDENGKYGFIDKSGALVIPCDYSRAKGFSEGLAAVREDEGHWGYIDKKGKIIIPMEIYEAYSFSEGLAYVHNGKKSGYIDKYGSLVIDKNWKGRSFSEGLACGRGYYVGNKDYYIDRKGNNVLRPECKIAYDFSEGLALVLGENGKYGFIDKSGTFVSPCKWKMAFSFSEGLARVVDENEKEGFIDKSGVLVIPCKYNRATGFSEGLAVVEDSGGCYVINTAGKVVRTLKNIKRVI